MAIAKTIRVRILDDTWPSPAEIPAALRGAQGIVPIDVLSSLLFAALWMRPPVRYGFSLSDCWAWLRYFPAICVNPELRLREEWSPLDPHHKTVLSGDFGVGFTTWFLHRTLGFVKYSDTLWVVNVLAPGEFQLGNGTQRGPQKSPDYIAEDSAGHFSVLECKGTQTSYASLLQAIQRGVPQKANLHAIGAAQIRHSLVAGLFVPQFANPEGPVLVVADPDWRELRERLERFSAGELGRGVSQIAFAKELAMLDLSQTANTLARAKGSAESVTGAFSRDARSQSPDRTIARDEVTVRREYLWPEPTRIAAGVRIAGVRFEGKLPADEIAKLRTVESPEEHGEQKRETSRGAKWDVGGDDLSVQLRSPLGSIFRLHLLEA